jgi:hypothetical protein
MNKTLFSLLMLTVFAAPPAFANNDGPKSPSWFTGKMECQNGMKKAGFKDPATNNVTFYSLSEISHQAQTLNWPDSSNPMSFDDREKRKTQLQRVTKLLHEMSCDDPSTQTAKPDWPEGPTYGAPAEAHAPEAPIVQ